MKNIIVPLIGLLVLSFACVDVRAESYAVVVTKKTYADEAWKAVADELVRKHGGQLIVCEKSLWESGVELAARRPRYACFVTPPESAGRDLVVNIHRLTRKLDDDPYTDVIWGILTGYDAADALRIAKCAEPLVIRRGFTSMGPGALGGYESGFATNETNKNEFWTKAKNAKPEKKTFDPDATQALVEAFNADGPDVMFTSGHASEHDWQIIYNAPGGQLRCKDGQLFGFDTKRQRFDIHSPNPKVYLPVGNCLIGHVSGKNCMTTAWIHSGGVHQMFGYTVPTWFGYGGWGVGDYFGQGGRFNLAESFFLNSQSLVHQIATRFPKSLKVEFESYDDKAIGYLAQVHGLRDKDEMGLLWDRDTVAFYGDPAWDARYPKSAGAWEQELTGKDGQYTFTVTATADGNWPGRPVAMLFPQRLGDIKITAGGNFSPVITENFLLLPLKGAFKKGQQVRVAFTATPIDKPDPAAMEQLNKARAAITALPEEMRPALWRALFLAGDKRGQWLELLAQPDARKRTCAAFLVANMPDDDLRMLEGKYISANIDLALQARDKAPWSKGITEEMFLCDVLPYATLGEKREEWRKDFFDRFAAAAWTCKTPGEAAMKLNREIFKALGVEYHATKRPKPCQSPSESIAAKYASCTGLSILLVDACRAAGIPARIAGIPTWKKGGNHNWVEIWDGSWHHLGAIEDTPLDKTWFTPKAHDEAGREWFNRIYATSFQRTGRFFPLVWDLADHSICAVDVTEAYAKQ